MHRRPQSLDAVHRRPVAGDANHRPLRIRELDAQGAGDALADPAAAAIEIIPGTAEAECARDLGAAGDRFLDDRRLFGHCRRQCLQREGNRHRPPFLHPFEARAPLRPLRLPERREALVAAVGGGCECGRTVRQDQRGDRFQSGPDAGDQAGSEPVIAGEPLRRFLDLDHRRARRERSGGRIPDLLEEGTARQQHQIGVAEALRDPRRVGRQAAPKIGMRVGNRLVLVDELGPDAGASRLRQPQDGIARARPRDIVSDHDRGFGGGEELPGDGADAFGIRRGGAVQRARGDGGDIGLLLHHVDRQGDKHRARGRIVGGLESAPHDRFKERSRRRFRPGRSISPQAPPWPPGRGRAADRAAGAGYPAVRP